MKFDLNTDKSVCNHIRIVCSPKVMQEVIDILAELHLNSKGNAKHLYNEAGCCYMFKSGAKLYWTEKSNYHIHCYHYDGKDGLAAVAELKTAMHLREAQRQYWKLQQMTGPYDGKVKHLRFTAEWRTTSLVDEFRRAAGIKD